MAVKAPPVPAAAATGGVFWGEVDYLGWSGKGDPLPPLVTTSPTGTTLGSVGVLGAPGTTVLFGDDTVNDKWRSGVRLQGGYWFNPGRTSGLEASFFELQNVSTSFNRSAPFGDPILARPFFNTLTNAQDAVIVAFPGQAFGSVSASDSSRLFGAGVLYRQQIGSWANQQVSGLIGYRYLRLSDSLVVANTTTAVLFLSTVSPTDSFSAKSTFQGVDLGLVGESQLGSWSFEWRGKVALGANYNHEQIAGSTVATVGGVSTTTPIGFLALSSNSGDFNQTRFAVVPELDLTVGYQVTPQWRIVAGYSILYWTNVQRAGNLIDTTINPNLTTFPPTPGGPARPQPQFNTSDFFAQGFNVGLRFGY